MKLSVAPMMDWTDRHCRVFHRLLHPSAVLYTEMVHAQAVIHGDRNRLLDFDASEHPLVLQLGGSDPHDLAEACRIAEDWGYDEINLNVGCPSDRVQAGKFGACLMREPVLVRECITAMANATKVPVTVKCRLGVDQDETYEPLKTFVDEVAHAPCTHFIVHARKAWLQGLSPKENREVPPLRYDFVHRLKQERPELAISINGGLADVPTVQEQWRHVDGVMIGRAAYHTPYFLHELAAEMDPEITVLGREQTLEAYRPYVEGKLAEGVPLRVMMRHVLGLFKSQPGGRKFRQILGEGMTRRDADWSLVLQAMHACQTHAHEARPA